MFLLFFFQWKKKVEKIKAQRRFKAVGSIAKLSIAFSTESNTTTIEEKSKEIGNI